MSLRSKILLVAATLVLLSQAGTVATVLTTAKRDVSERATRALESGAEVFLRTNEVRTAQLGGTVSALAADFGFKRAVATRDQATIESALRNHVRRARADVAMLLDERGRVLAQVGLEVAAGTREEALVASVAENAVGVYAGARAGRIFEFITVPVKAPLPVAWVSMGFSVDGGLTRQLEELTGLQVTIVAENENVRLAVSSRPISVRLGELPDVRPGAVGGAGRSSLDGDEYAWIASALVPGFDEVWVVLSQSIAEAMAPYRLLQTAALVLGAVPILLALIGAAVLARTLTRPVQQLAAAADRLRVGDYSQPVEIGGHDELARLAEAFNVMQDGIARREERITYQATHDSVTDLPNRDYLLEQLATFIDSDATGGRQLGVMVVHLNSQSDIGESLGHDIADAFVFQAAALIREELDEPRWFGRLDADAFLMLVRDESAATCERLAGRIVSCLQAGVPLHGMDLGVQPTVGIACYPGDGRAADQLLLRATIAAASSAAGAGAIRRYRAGDEERRVRRTRILSDLRSAVQGDALELAFQPKLCLKTRRVCGAEALVRWRHPELGDLSPAEFIPIAEQSGNISLLSRWVLERAVRACFDWQSRGWDIDVSVNLSAHDLGDPQLPAAVAEALRQSGLAPSRLIVEITEEAVVQDAAQAIDCLRRMRASGVRVAIDDFGTGYSSLSQMRDLPVDELKIDRSFVMRLPASRDDAAIVRATIDLAHRLGLEFVAEGVETEAALEWLAEQGAERAQGYLISRPVGSDEFASCLQFAQRQGGDDRVRSKVV